MAWGGWAGLLIVVSGQYLVVAGALLQPMGNRVASATVGALLTVILGGAPPFTVGFANAYDAWPWRSFAPFAVILAVGLLLTATRTLLWLFSCLADSTAFALVG